MKKLALALLCGLCLLAAAPVYAQTDEVAAATSVVKAYYDTAIKGDVDASLTYMSKKYRAETEELLAGTEGLKELGVLLLKRTEYEIVTVKPRDQNMVATTKLTTPDMDYIFLKASEDMDPNMTEEEFTTLIIKEASELMAKGQNIPRTEDEITMLLIKENGQWKIDEEY